MYPNIERKKRKHITKGDRTCEQTGTCVTLLSLHLNTEFVANE